MNYDASDHQRFFDQQAIREVLDDYWFGLGRHDVEMVVGTFAQEATYGVASGIEAIRRNVEMISSLRCINILRGSQRIEIDGDEARADTQAVAFLVPMSSEGSEELLVQGLRYIDTLIRTEVGWRISHRTGQVTFDRPHDTPWEVSMGPVRPETPPTRGREPAEGAARNS